MVDSLYKPSRNAPSSFQNEKQEVIFPGALDLIRDRNFCVFPCISKATVIVVMRYVLDVCARISVISVYKMVTMYLYRARYVMAWLQAKI